MQILAKTFAVVAALLSVSTAQIFTMCESSIREANTDHVRMAGEMQLCLSNPDPGQLTGCQCNLLGGMVEVCQRFLGSCDDEALTHVWTHMRDMHQDHIQQLGCGNEAPVAQRLRHSPASSGSPGLGASTAEVPGLQASTARVPGLQASTAKVPGLQASTAQVPGIGGIFPKFTVTDARPLQVPGIGGVFPRVSCVSVGCTVDTVQASSFAFGPDWLISTQEGVGGIAVMLLMVLVLIAVTVAFLARRRQAPSEVEIADIGRP